MASDGGEILWNRFVQIAQSIPRASKSARPLHAQRALQLAQRILENGSTIICTDEREVLFHELVDQSAAYLDGVSESVNNAVSQYFSNMFGSIGKMPGEFSIRFTPKRSGIQAGSMCIVTCENLETCYFVKTRQHGPTADVLRSVAPPDAKEMLVYKFLEHIGVGPDVHFAIPVHGSERTINIVTKDAEVILLSKLTAETANFDALLRMDLLCRLLCLQDCTTNSGNCGQTVHGGHPMIIDFRMESNLSGYEKQVIPGFMTGNSEFNYCGLMEVASKMPNERKITIVQQVIAEWNFVENWQQALRDILAFRSLPRNNFVSVVDLERYASDIVKNWDGIRAWLLKQTSE